MMRNQRENDSILPNKQFAGSFGSFPQDPALTSKAEFFRRGQRKRINVSPVCLSLLLPWLFFCFVFAVMSFQWHYTKPGLCYSLVGVGLLVALITVGFAVSASLQRNRDVQEDLPPRPPSWLVFLAITAIAAWILGVLLGDLNFWTNMQPYYDYTNLNDHWSIDPAKTRGQELMDAGRVYFTNTSTLDLRRSMGFRNLDTYCVPPITVKADGVLAPLASYDFWAVGLGCCEGNAADFHCGEYNDPAAHQGLRLLRDDQRPFFRLAVQQAQATYGIKASHPLFFYWAKDASAEMNSFRDEGYKYYLIGMLVHFAWQMLCVGLAVASFVKLGRS